MRILVCPPRYFGVDYVINPWMESKIGSVAPRDAWAQWSDLVEDLARWAVVEQVEPAEGSPDMCFTANAGLVAGNQAVPARFRMAERRAEQAPFEAWFARNGFRVEPLEKGQSEASSAFEGEGDALFQPGQPLLWAGHGPRSDASVHARLAEVFGVEVVSLRLVDPRFYHLDTCFVPLPGGRVAYYPGAFDAEGRRAIESRFPAANRLEVEEADAVGFACNMLRLGERLFVNQAGAGLTDRLRGWGFEVRQHPVGEFLKAGGGVKCLCLILDQDPLLAP